MAWVLLIVFVDEPVDGCLEIDDGSEDVALQPTARQDGKEAFTAFSHELEVGAT